MRQAVLGPEADRLLSFDGRDAALLAALLALAVVILLPVLAAGNGMAPGLGGGLPGYDDARTQWYPWRAYAARCMKDGVLPLWNPYILCGTPFVGNFQSALFYPPNVLFLLMPVYLAARASLLVHVTLSLIFTYLLAKAVGSGRCGAGVAAMAFTFGSAQLLRVPAGHWGATCAIPWMPLVFLCVVALLRRPSVGVAVAGGAAVALQILSGMPQYVFITGVSVVVFVLIWSARDGLSWRGRLWRWGVVGGVFALGAAMAAIQLLPGLEAAMYGARSLPMRAAWVEQFSLGPECLFTLLVPGFFGGTMGVPWWGRWLFWEMTAYAGVVCLALAIVGALTRTRGACGARWGILAVFMLLLALGRHTPLTGLLAWALPVGGMFRGAAKFLLPFQLALAVAAGLGASELARGVAGVRRRAVIVSAVLFGVALILTGLGMVGLAGVRDGVLRSGESLSPAAASLPEGALSGPAVAGGAAAMVLLGVFAAGQFLMRGSAKLSGGRAAAALILILVAVDAARFGRQFIDKEANSRAEGLSWSAGAVRHLRMRDGMRRVYVMGDRHLNDGMLAAVPTVEGIEPNPPARFHELFMRAQGMSADVAPSIYQVRRWDAIASRTALARILAPVEARRLPPGAKVKWEGEDAKVADVAGVGPRVFAVSSDGAYFASDKRDALRAALDPEYAGRLVIEGVEAGRRGASSGKGRVFPARIMEEGPNRVSVSVDAGAAGWLVLLDNYYPGWRARVDGRPVAIHPANYAFRGVPIEAGAHSVEFTYAPASLRWGAVISFLALAAGAGLVVGGYVRGRRPMVYD